MLPRDTREAVCPEHPDPCEYLQQPSQGKERNTPIKTHCPLRLKGNHVMSVPQCQHIQSRHTQTPCPFKSLHIMPSCTTAPTGMWHVRVSQKTCSVHEAVTEHCYNRCSFFLCNRMCNWTLLGAHFSYATVCVHPIYHILLELLALQPSVIHPHVKCNLQNYCTFLCARNMHYPTQYKYTCRCMYYMYMWHTIHAHCTH